MAAKMGGIDWASEIHALCAVDEQGARVREPMVDHSGTGIAALCRELVALEVERVAIERPDGILVDRLLETRHHGDRRAPQPGQGRPGALLGGPRQE